MDFQEVFDVLVTSLLKLSVIIIPIIIGVLTPMLVKYLNELKKKLTNLECFIARNQSDF